MLEVWSIVIKRFDFVLSRQTDIVYKKACDEPI